MCGCSSTEERFTLDEITSVVREAWNNMDYVAFVENILRVPPRKNDAWQLEKWQDFQNVCRSLLCFPKEYLARVIQANLE